jgi:competence ComEA-like helix-hairpin-helix protein
MGAPLPFRHRTRRALALVIVLWVLVILSIVVLVFAHLTRVELQLADNAYQRDRALYVAEGGVQRLMLSLQSDTSGYTGLDQEWAALDSRNEDLPFDEEAYGLTTTDECAKVNINSADEDTLLRLPGMTQEIADSIIDWRDQDDSARPQGAETEYYQALNPPYKAANRPFVTIEELLLVRGVTSDTFYGAGQTSGAPQAAGAQQNPGLVNLLTVYSTSPDADETGQARLNINSATQQQLEDRLGEALARGEAQAIIDYRQEHGSFDTPADVWGVPGVDRKKMQQILGRITTRGGTVQTAAPTATPTTPRGGTSTIPGMPELPLSGGLPGGVQTRQAPGSGGGGQTPGTGTPGLPGLPGESGLPGLTQPGEEEAPPEEEAPSSSQKPTIVPGLININTAPAEVLLSLPQMTEEIAQAIVTQRQSQPFQTLGDLLGVEQVDQTLLKAIVQQITTRSLTFRTIARGTIEERRVAAEITTVVDMSQDSPRLVYYKRGDTTANQYRPVRTTGEPAPAQASPAGVSR